MGVVLHNRVPGECPLLTSEYAVHIVKGIQEGPDARYLQAAATIKHFTMCAFTESTPKQNQKRDNTDDKLEQRPSLLTF